MVHKTGCPTSKPLVARDLIDWNKLDKDIKEWESTTKYVIQDMKAREAFGLQKYGKSLTVNTDEDMLQHLYEELLDAAVYIKTLIMQRQSR